MSWYAIFRKWNTIGEYYVIIRILRTKTIATFAETKNETAFSPTPLKILEGQQNFQIYWKKLVKKANCKDWLRNILV